MVCCALCNVCDSIVPVLLDFFCPSCTQDSTIIPWVRVIPGCVHAWRCGMQSGGGVVLSVLFDWTSLSGHSE